MHPSSRAGRPHDTRQPLAKSASCREPNAIRRRRTSSGGAPESRARSHCALASASASMKSRHRCEVCGPSPSPHAVRRTATSSKPRIFFTRSYARKGVVSPQGTQPAGDRYGRDVSGRTGQPFIDPMPGLQRDYEAAVEALREELGEPNTFIERWHFWRRKRRLRRDLVVRPLRSANW
jgi:hypothetical protein